MIKLRPHQERIVKTMTHTTKGQVIVPTGGGKTMCMINDAQSQFQYGNQTVVLSCSDSPLCTCNTLALSIIFKKSLDNCCANNILGATTTTV